MRDRLTGLLRRGKDGWAAFTPGQKAVTVFAVLALAVGGYFFATWAGKPTMAPLFSNLAASDASAIVDKLNADGVTYSLSDGGGTINVPSDQVYNLRIAMSGAGLPAAGEAGYALLDKQGIMTSEFMQQITYRRALEGELGKTIEAINGVNTATVHLAIPQKDVFTDDQVAPTASVLVDTGSRPLPNGAVTSIVHLVSSSVEGLEPDAVTVVGANGKVLSSSGDGAGSSPDGQSGQTSAYEQRLNSALQNMLDTVVGPGHSVVQVTADLDFDNTETKTQKYVADPAVPPLSESKTSEQYTGGNGTPVGGVLGPDNIQVPNGTGAGANGDGTYQQSTETRNNAVGMVTETKKSAPGAVKKLAVAVIVDSTAAKIDEAQLQQLVSSAVGLDATRGDQIAVSSMAFDTSKAESEKSAAADAAKAEQGELQQKYIQMGLIILALLILLIVAAISGRRRRKAEKQKLTEQQSAALEEMQAAIEAARIKLALEGQGGLGSTHALEGAGGPGKEFDRDGRFRDLTEMVEKQPDEVAQLLRGWLADRRG